MPVFAEPLVQFGKDKELQYKTYSKNSVPVEKEGGKLAMEIMSH